MGGLGDNKRSFSLEEDLQMLLNEKCKHSRNPLFGYLNINSLRNKCTDLKEILNLIQLDYFVVGETKLDDSFPSAQFFIDDYEIRARRDRNRNGGGLIEYVRKGLICKRIRQFETKTSESIASEVTVSKTKWFVLSIYRPPDASNLTSFFDELTTSLSNASSKYDSFIVSGDFNIDIKAKGQGFQKLDDFCSMFGLTNLVHAATCITPTHKSTIDLILSNKTSSFQKPW